MSTQGSPCRECIGYSNEKNAVYFPVNEMNIFRSDLTGVWGVLFPGIYPYVTQATRQKVSVSIRPLNIRTRTKLHGLATASCRFAAMLMHYTHNTARAIE